MKNFTNDEIEARISTKIPEHSDKNPIPQGDDPNHYLQAEELNIIVKFLDENTAIVKELMKNSNELGFSVENYIQLYNSDEEFQIFYDEGLSSKIYFNPATEVIRIGLLDSDGFKEYNFSEIHKIPQLKSALDNEIVERARVDALKLNKPTQNATNQYVLLADGSTSLKSDFGKVNTVNNISPDENKNVNVDLDNVLSKGNTSTTREIRVRGLRLKSLFENDIPSLRPNLLNIQDNIYSGNITIDGENILVNGFCINFSDTRTNNNLYVIPENLTSSTRTLVLPTKKDGKIALTSDIQSIFSQYTNWTNPSQRFSALVSKHNDATYNRLLGMDANGNVNEVGLPAITNEMSKSTDAQKDAWRVANRKSDETYSIGVPRVDYCYPYIVDSRKDYLQYIYFYGINLFLDLKNSSLKLVNITTSQAITVDNFEVVTGLTTFLKIGLNFNLIPNGEYHLVITNPLGFTNIDTCKFTVSNSVQQVDLSAFEIANENFKIGTDFQSSISPTNITFQNLRGSGNDNLALERRLVTKSKVLPVTGNFILDFNFNVLKSENLADNNTGIQHSFGIVSSGSVLTDSGITPSIGYQFKAVNIGLFSSSKVIAYAGFPSGLYRARIVRQNGQFEVSIVLPNNTVLSDIIPDTLGSTIDIVSNFTGFYVSNSAQIVFELLSITN